MARRVVQALMSVVFLAVLFSPFDPSAISAIQEEKIVGVVTRSGKTFVIEADDGDYIVKGKDLSKLVGKLVEVTGTITESDKGQTIEAKSVEEIQE
jgi:hypothetical protein